MTIASRNLDRLQSAAQELSSVGPVDAVRCNIRDEQEVASTVKSVLDKHGALHFLVNNGGGQFQALSHDISLKGWKAVIETNLNGVYYTLESPPLGTGQVDVQFNFIRTKPFGGTGELFVNGKKVDRFTLDQDDVVQIGHTRIKYIPAVDGSPDGPSHGSQWSGDDMFEESSINHVGSTFHFLRTS